MSSIYADLPELDDAHAICWACNSIFLIDSSPNLILCAGCDEAAWAEAVDGGE